MDAVFKIAGIALALYVVYGLYSGSIHDTCAGWKGSSVRRDRSAEPAHYWGTVAVYSALSLALLTIF